MQITFFGQTSYSCLSVTFLTFHPISNSRFWMFDQGSVDSAHSIDCLACLLRSIPEHIMM